MMIISDEKVCLIQNLKRMLNLKLQKTCKILSFCLNSQKFLMLEHYFRQKRASIEKNIFEKGKKGQQFFQGGPRAPLASPPELRHYFREALTTPEIGLFREIRLFYPRNPESYATFRLSGRPILCKLNLYVVRMKQPRSVYTYSKKACRKFLFLLKKLLLSISSSQILQSSGFFCEGKIFKRS